MPLYFRLNRANSEGSRRQSVSCLGRSIIGVHAYRGKWLDQLALARSKSWQNLIIERPAWQLGRTPYSQPPFDSIVIKEALHTSKGRHSRDYKRIRTAVRLNTR
jgi:hypothetical protein